MSVRLNPEVLDRARQIEGLDTDDELAAALGKTAVTIRAWRSGKVSPNLAALAALKLITGIPMDRMAIEESASA